MPKQSENDYSPEEAQRRFRATVRGAISTPPKPLKSMTPKRRKAQQERDEKDHKAAR